MQVIPEVFQRVSLKYKLLVLLVLAPVGSLVAYLFMATDIFQTDKLAYVYDSNLTNIKNLTSQFTSDLKLVKKSREVVLTGFNPEKENFDKFAQDDFSSEESLLLIRLYRNAGVADFKMVANLEKEGLEKETTSYVEDNLKEAFSEVLTKEEIVRVVDPKKGIFVLYSLYKSRDG